MNNKHSNELCHSQFQGDELYHHGILGMHWGIRRFQPYGHGGYNPQHDGKYVGSEKNVKNLDRKIDKTATSNKAGGLSGFKEDQYGLQKTAKTKSGKPVKLRIWNDVDPKSVERNVKYVERNLDKIVKDAIDFYTKRDASFFAQSPNHEGLHGKSLKEIAKMLDVSSIDVSNGLVSLQPKEGSPLSWAMPWVEIDLDTGEPLYTGTDS